MSVLFQDVVVTTVACLAAFVLLQRLKSVVYPSRRSSACESCPKCEGPGTGREPLES
jgi:hypothetical protein